MKTRLVITALALTTSFILPATLANENIVEDIGAFTIDDLQFV